MKSVKMLSLPENCCLCPHETIYLECLAFHINTRHIFKTTKVNTSQNISKIKEKKKFYQILHAMELPFGQNYIILTSEHTQGGKFNIQFQQLPNTIQTSFK